MKNTFKKIAALAAAALLVVAMAVPVFATEYPSGKGGDGSLTIENASYGETYAAYKIFDAKLNDAQDSASGITYYATADQKNAFEALTGNVFTFTAISDGTYEVGVKADADVISFLKDLSSIPGAVQEFSGDADATGVMAITGLPYGYYYVTSSLGSVVTIDSTNGAATIYDKNTSTPSVPEDPKTAAAATKSVGQIDTYTLTFTATNYYNTENATAEPQKIYNYTIVDTSEDIAVDTTTVTVKVGDTTLTADDYTVTYEDGTMTIVIPWTTDGTADTDFLYANNSNVVITYDAEILALDDATNEATFNWNTENEFGEGSTDVKNYDINFEKTDSQGELLAGAEFTLYTADEDGAQTTTPINLVKIQDGWYRLANSEDDAATIVTTIVVADGTENLENTFKEGFAKIEGLENGTYYLQEDKAPSGYNKLTEAITVTIDNADVAADKVQIVNYTGSELPSTGGIGTTIFYIVGGVLVVAAIVVLVVKRRRAE